MSERSKRPISSAPAPTYPDSRGFLGRRAFFALLGGGAAAALIGGCGQEEDTDDVVPRLGGAPPRVIDRPDEGGVPRALPKVILPGAIEGSNDPTAPEIEPGGRTVHVRDRLSVRYALYFSYEGPPWREAIAAMEEVLLLQADDYLSRSFTRGAQRDADRMARLREGLAGIYSGVIPDSAGFSFLEVRILDVNDAPRPRGKIAPSRPKPPLLPGDDALRDFEL